MILRVKATPNAKRSEVLGWNSDPLVGEYIRIRVAAPPVNGKANKAIRDFLAEQLGIAKSTITLKKGQTVRFKCFELPDHTDLSPLRKPSFKANVSFFIMTPFSIVKGDLMHILSLHLIHN